MPGFRMITNGPTDAEGKRIATYIADTKSAACPNCFSQEETIKAIWHESAKKPRHVSGTASAEAGSRR